MKTFTMMLTTAVLAFATSTDINAQQGRQNKVQKAQKTVQQHRVLRPDLWPAPTPKLGLTGYFYQGWGFKILSVLPGTPASRMGLEPGDVIKSLNGYRISSNGSLGVALRDARDYHGGSLRLIVDNVRARNGWDPHAQRIVRVNGSLYGTHYPGPPVEVYRTQRQSQTQPRIETRVNKTQVRKTQTRTSNRNR